MMSLSSDRLGSTGASGEVNKQLVDVNRVSRCRRFVKQVRMEYLLLKSNYTWAVVLLGLFIQQILHGIHTNIVFANYEVRPILKDVSFSLLPHLQEEYFWVSEAIFYPILFFGVASLLRSLIVGIIFGSPPPLKDCHNFVTIGKRVLTQLIVCQTLRELSFSFTILPGPANHCQNAMHPDYHKPTSLNDVFFRVNVSHGCGDLIFSSHTIFSLTMCLAVTRYMHSRLATYLVWTVQFFLLGCILASHKHYTVDVVVACYTVPLVWYLLQVVMKDPPPLMWHDKKSLKVLRKRSLENTQWDDLYTRNKSTTKHIYKAIDATNDFII